MPFDTFYNQHTKALSETDSRGERELTSKRNVFMATTWFVGLWWHLCTSPYVPLPSCDMVTYSDNLVEPSRICGARPFGYRMMAKRGPKGFQVDGGLVVTFVCAVEASWSMVIWLDEHLDWRRI